MPNRSTIPIILGNWCGDNCRLLLSGADVVEDQPADDGIDCSADHSHAELDNNIHNITSLLKRKLTAVKGSGIEQIISENFQRINIFAWIDVERALIGENYKARLGTRRFLDEFALNVIDGDFRGVLSFGKIGGEFGGKLQSLIADIA